MTVLKLPVYYLSFVRCHHKSVTRGRHLFGNRSFHSQVVSQPQIAIMTNFLTSWHIFDIMTNFSLDYVFLMSWHIFDKLFDIMTNVLTSGHIFLYYDILFDVITYFLYYDVFLTLWRTLWCYDEFCWRHYVFLTSWQTFWCHDVFLMSWWTF